MSYSPPTVEDAVAALSATALQWNQSAENAGWFYVVLSPTTVTKVWYEDVEAFLGSIGQRLGS